MVIKLERLEPERHILYIGNNGITKEIVKEYTKKGIIKTKLALAERGYDEYNILAVYGPTGSVTNTPRERKIGFEDGVRLAMDGYILTYIKPGCAYGVFRIDEFDEKIEKEMREIYEKLRKEGFYVDGVKVKPWTDKEHRNSNHFLEVWKNSEEYYLAIHTEYDPNKDIIKELEMEYATDVVTPLGKVKLIEDNEKDRFLRDVHDKIDKKTIEKIRILANTLYPGCKEVFLQIHKTYSKKDGFYLIDASNHTSFINGKSNIAPICFSDHLPVYFIEGKKNLDLSLLDDKEYEHVVEDSGRKRILERINLLPHGGGETKDDFLNGYTSVKLKIREKKGNVAFRLILNGNEGTKEIKDPSTEIDRRFRTPKEVLGEIEKFGLGKTIKKFEIVSTIGKKLYKDV